MLDAEIQHKEGRRLAPFFVIRLNNCEVFQPQQRSL